MALPTPPDVHTTPPPAPPPLSRRVALSALAVLLAAGSAKYVAAVLLGQGKPGHPLAVGTPKTLAIPTAWVRLAPDVTPASEVTPNASQLAGAGPPLQFWHPFGPDAGAEESAHAAIWRVCTAVTALPIAAVAIPATTSENLLVQLGAAIAAGSAPDAVCLDRLQLPAALTAQLITNLTDHTGDRGVAAGAFYPHVWEDVTLAGHLMAVPFGADARGLWWRKDYLTEQKVNPDEGPATLDVLTRLASPPVTTPQGTEQWGYSPYVGDDHPYTLGMLFDARWYDPGTRRLTAAAPPNMETLTWYANRKDSGLPPSAIGGSSPLISGEVQALVGGHWLLGELSPTQQSLYGAAPLPSAAGRGATTTWSSGYGIAVPFGATFPDRSWQFAAFYAGTTASLAYVGAGGRRVMPAQPQLAANPAVRAPGKLWQTFLAMLPTAWARPAMPEAAVAWSALADAAIRVRRGDEAPTLALQAVDTAVNGALQRAGW